MNFLEAIELMESGHKLKRALWPGFNEQTYIFIHEYQGTNVVSIYVNGGGIPLKYDFTYEDVKAKDWVLHIVF